MEQIWEINNWLLKSSVSEYPSARADRSSKARTLEDRGDRGIARQLISKQRPSDCCVNYSKGYNGLNGDAP